ncbi:MAG: DUF4367 domain-containing protein, partial [Anaerolineales bacterium]
IFSRDFVADKVANKVAKMRPALIAITLVLVLTASLAIPSVRAAAVNFLGLFRVQQIEVVEFNPANLPPDMERGMTDIERVLSEDLVISDRGEPVEVSDAAEASELAGFPVVLPKGVKGEKRITYQLAVQASFEVNLELWNGLLADIGRSDIELPKALDGQTITFDLPNSVTFAAGTCALDVEEAQGILYHQRTCTMLIQMPSPTIDAPPGLPIDQVGEAFLQIFGMSPEEAARFSERVDWATTLVIPVPQGAEYADVTVNGVPGTLFERAYGENGEYTLMWIKNGIFYALSGEGDARDALELANSLK